MKKEKWRAKDYVVIPRSILVQEISPSALRLWIALASYCYDSDSCYPSNKSILSRMPPGTALNTVRSAKRELEEKGLIRRERRFVKGQETSSLYYLLHPKGTELVEGNDTVTHRANQAITQNKENKIKSIKGNQMKRTKDGFVFMEDEGIWVEE